MNIDEIKNIGVIGSGTMGRGIVISVALSGYGIIVYDVNESVLEKAKKAIEKTLSKSVEKNKISPEMKSETMRRIVFSPEFSKLGDCDFIIEAAPEEMELKKNIFTKLDEVCGKDTILTSNTSSLSVTAISSFVKNNPGRVAGMHFFNPANIMKLVEVVRGDFSSDETINLITELSQKIGKVPVVAKDTPAFIVNRIARPFYGEALKILAEGSADFLTIDKVMKSCGGFSMGPFELMDMIGIDINFSVTKSVYEAYFHDQRYKPSYIQKKMVDSNLLGRKTNKGFYNYDEK